MYYTLFMEKEMATHSSILAGRIPRTEEPGRLQCVALQESDRTWRLNPPHHHHTLFKNRLQKKNNQRTIDGHFCFLDVKKADVHRAVGKIHLPDGKTLVLGTSQHVNSDAVKPAHSISFFTVLLSLLLDNKYK